jgi:hypothetical protein
MAQMVQALRGETRLDARAVRQVVRPALLGFMDGMVSTLAPLFAAAELGKSFLSALTGQASWQRTLPVATNFGPASSLACARLRSAGDTHTAFDSIPRDFDYS